MGCAFTGASRRRLTSFFGALTLAFFHTLFGIMFWQGFRKKQEAHLRVPADVNAPPLFIVPWKMLHARKKAK